MAKSSSTVNWNNISSAIGLKFARQCKKRLHFRKKITTKGKECQFRILELIIDAIKTIKIKAFIIKYSKGDLIYIFSWIYKNLKGYQLYAILMIVSICNRVAVYTKIKLVAWDRTLLNFWWLPLGWSLPHIADFSWENCFLCIWHRCRPCTQCSCWPMVYNYYPPAQSWNHTECKSARQYHRDISNTPEYWCLKLKCCQLYRFLHSVLDNCNWY